MNQFQLGRRQFERNSVSLPRRHWNLHCPETILVSWLLVQHLRAPKTTHWNWNARKTNPLNDNFLCQCIPRRCKRTFANEGVGNAEKSVRTWPPFLLAAIAVVTLTWSCNKQNVFLSCDRKLVLREHSASNALWMDSHRKLRAAFRQRRPFCWRAGSLGWLSQWRELHLQKKARPVPTKHQNACQQNKMAGWSSFWSGANSCFEKRPLWLLIFQHWNTVVSGKLKQNKKQRQTQRLQKSTHPWPFYTPAFRFVMSTTLGIEHILYRFCKRRQCALMDAALSVCQLWHISITRTLAVLPRVAGKKPPRPLHSTCNLVKRDPYPKNSARVSGQFLQILRRVLPKIHSHRACARLQTNWLLWNVQRRQRCQFFLKQSHALHYVHPVSHVLCQWCSSLCETEYKIYLHFSRQKSCVFLFHVTQCFPQATYLQNPANNVLMLWRWTCFESVHPKQRSQTETGWKEDVTCWRRSGESLTVRPPGLPGLVTPTAKEKNTCLQTWNNHTARMFNNFICSSTRKISSLFLDKKQSLDTGSSRA